jgi:hypothetical protein
MTVPDVDLRIVSEIRSNMCEGEGLRISVYRDSDGEEEATGVCLDRLGIPDASGKSYETYMCQFAEEDLRRVELWMRAVADAIASIRKVGEEEVDAA